MQNDMRDRLVDLIKECHKKENDIMFGENRPLEFDEWTGIYADHLIANGVIVPPCKVGDKVYTISIDREIEEYTVLGVVEYPNGWFVGVHYGGCSYTIPVDKVFFTKDQAEQKLKELSENG